MLDYASECGGHGKGVIKLHTDFKGVEDETGEAVTYA